MKIVYPYDTTPFVKISIHEVVKTLVEAIIWCSGHVSVPAELPRHPDPHHRGTGGPVRHLRGAGGVGFSINTLTMFGMVLAIGLLVDDAIVVENVERVMAEEGLPPKEATRKSMDRFRARW